MKLAEIDALILKIDAYADLDTSARMLMGSLHMPEFSVQAFVDLGLPHNEVAQCAQRFIDNGIWSEHFFPPDNNVEFWLWVSCGAGTLKRFRNSEGVWEYESAEIGLNYINKAVRRKT